MWLFPKPKWIFVVDAIFIFKKGHVYIFNPSTLSHGNTLSDFGVIVFLNQYNLQDCYYTVYIKWRENLLLDIQSSWRKGILQI